MGIFKKSEAHVQERLGCSCKAFRDACASDFIELGDKEVRLGSRTSTVAGPGVGWSTAYGPKISFCPFCGRRLVSK